MRTAIFAFLVFFNVALLSAHPKKLVLACVDCFDSIYPKLTDLYFPKTEVQWILVPTFPYTQSELDRVNNSFPKSAIFLGHRSPMYLPQVKALGQFLKEKKVDAVLQGTDNSFLVANILNSCLDKNYNLQKTRSQRIQLLKKVIADFGPPPTTPLTSGKKYYLQTYTYNGETKPTGLGEAFQLLLPDSSSYFVDRSESLFSEAGKQLASIATIINERMQLKNGPAHLKFAHDEATGNWYLLEYHSEVVGNGVAEIEREVWAGNQQVLHLLRLLDEENFLELWKTFPRYRYKDSLIFLAPSAFNGTLKESGLYEIMRLKTLRWPSDSYIPSINRKIGALSSDLTLRFVGKTKEIQSDFEASYRLLTQGHLIDPENSEQTCPIALGRHSMLSKAMETAKAGIRWSYRP